MRVAFGEIYVEDPSAFRADYAAFIDSKYVVSLDVVEFAANKALKNWQKGRRISRSLPIEILLHYAATRQIKDALKLGVKKGLNRVAAVILDESKMESFKEIEFRPEYDAEAVVKHYGITDEEFEIAGLEKLPLLVRERIALFAAFEEVV